MTLHRLKCHILMPLVYLPEYFNLCMLLSRYMRIRYNKVLKIFATLLFLLEFLSPIMLASASTLERDTLHPQLIRADHAHNFVYSIFREDSPESEENKEDHKGSVVLLDFSISSLRVTTIKSSDCLHQYFLTSHRYTIQPPLFKLNCIFII